MGSVKGNPIILVTLFFGAAVLSMGGIYALIPAILDQPTLGSAAILVALCLSLGFSLLVIGRVFWVVSRATRRPAAVKLSEKRSSGAR